VSEKKAFQYAVDKYNQLSADEKAAAVNTYQQVIYIVFFYLGSKFKLNLAFCNLQTLNEYNEEFFTFARQLPFQRVIDYRNFMSKVSFSKSGLVK
jgi:hypothetical protein